MARKCIETQEKRSIRSGRLAEFNSQFDDTVERGVLQELSLQEMAEYTRPLNYITMVEVVKNDPTHNHPAVDLHEATDTIWEVP